ncbi:hypothetical protein [Bdellovibrio bacteriovorus]|uniref:hypothetical protein n=1 Tax=Bdellovibrio bacteriovorus TaxID=959 RepID=UPI0035A579F6
MKKLLVVAALVTAAAPAAMASKARVEALNNSRHVLDFQSAFDRPYQFLALSEQATIEWGDKGAAAVDPHAEGGFVKRHGDDTAFGVYFGRRSADFSEAVQYARTTGGLANIIDEQNGLNLFYAGKMSEWTYGVTLKYSNGKDDSVDAKSSSSGLALGVTNGTWDVDLVQGLSAKSEVGSDGVESKGLTSLTVGYHMSPEMEVYGNFKTVKVEGTGALSAAKIEKTSYKVGMVNTLVKSDEGNFFYGVELASAKTDKVSESMTLPVYMGVEANAASWLVLRASVAQNVILNETKDITGGGTDGDKKDLDSTVMAAGAGFKFGKSMLDVTFKGAAAGEFNTNTDMFSQVAYTYTF